MLKLRLARHGSKKRPFYHIVAADERRARDGRYVEKIGTFNPMVSKEDKNRVNIDEERVKHWLKTGAQPTKKVQKLLSAFNLTDKPEITEQTKKHLPKAKTQERLKEKEEKKKAAEEAKKQAEEQAKQEAEKPKEEEKQPEESAQAAEKTEETKDEEKTEETKDEEKTDGEQPKEEDKKE